LTFIDLFIFYLKDLLNIVSLFHYSNHISNSAIYAAADFAQALV